MRKGIEVVGIRYAESRANGTYHFAEDGKGRLYLCDCGKQYIIRDRLKMTHCPKIKWRKRTASQKGRESYTSIWTRGR